MYMSATVRVALLAQLVRHEIPSVVEAVCGPPASPMAALRTSRALSVVRSQGTAGLLTPCGPADVRSRRSARSLARAYGTLTFIQAHLGLSPSATAARPPTAEATTTMIATPGTCSVRRGGGRG